MLLGKTFQGTMLGKSKPKIFIAAAVLVAALALMFSTDQDASASETGSLTRIDCLYSPTVQTIEGCGESVGLKGAASIAVSPDGAFAYTAAYESGTITAYRIDSGTGALTRIENGCMVGSNACSAEDGLDGAASIAVSPNGDFAFAAAYESNTLTAYRVNKDTGVLTQIENGCIAGADSHACGADDGLEGATDVEVSPDGEYAYAAAYESNTLTAYRIDQGTGVLTQIENGCVAGVDSHACGIDDGLEGAFALELNSEGRSAYATSYLANTITAYRVNSSTGVLTQIDNGCVAGDDSHECGIEDGLGGSTALVISPDDKYAYAASYESNTLTIYRIDSDTGALRQTDCLNTLYIHAIPGCDELEDLNGISSLAITSGGEHLYATASYSNTISTFKIDSDSGELDRIDVGCTAGDDNHKCGAGDGLDGVEAIALSPTDTYAFAVSIRGHAITAYTSGEPLDENPDPDPDPDPDPVPDPSPSPSPSPTPTPNPEPSPNPPGDKTAPTIKGPKTKGRIRRSFFRRGKKKRVLIKYSLSEDASVSLVIKTKRPRKICKITRSRKKKCKRSRILIRRRVKGRKGINRVKFKLKTKTLRRGLYTVEMLATDAARNTSKKARTRFRVIR